MRTHRVVLVALLACLVAMLTLTGVIHHEIGGEGDGGPHVAVGSDGVPPQVLDGGPVIDTRGGAQRSSHVAPGRIALTFDDGPDPTWTPRILDVLAKYHVPATFFLIGGHAAQSPDLVAREVASGDEVGVHTFTHGDLAVESSTRRGLELSQTQSVLAGAAGISTALLRPPYSSEPDALDRLDWAAVQDAGRRGYLVVLTDRDSVDWSRPGVDQIVKNSQPASPGRPGYVLMMHDGGGDRSQTVAALEKLIPLLKVRGYTFTTVSAAVGMPSPLRSAGTMTHLRGDIVIWLIQFTSAVLTWLEVLMLIAGALTLLRVVLLLIAARRHARTTDRYAIGPPMREPVSVIVPAYNEEAGIAATLRSLLAVDHPLEVIVVDDGSTDRTAEIVGGFAQFGVRLVRQLNRGKPAALDHGIAYAGFDIVVLLDGDTVFEPATIGRLVRPFADPRVGAVAGNAKVANRSGLLGRWQHIEYVVGFNLDRRLFDLAGCMPTVPGAVGAFRREALASVGGLSDATLAEDTDLTMAIVRAGWRVTYEPDAVAWTEAPATLGQLWKQRRRWCYGTMQAMWKHRSSVVRSGAEGRFGRRGLTYLALFQILLPLLAPAVDVFAIYGLVFHDLASVAVVWLAFLAMQTACAVYAFRLDGERLRPLWALPLQQLIYRQLMYLVVIESLVTALAGTRLRWHRMQRHGSLPQALESLASQHR